MNFLNTRKPNISYEVNKSCDSTSTESYTFDMSKTKDSKEEIHYVTSGSLDHYENYLVNLPDKINIFKKKYDVSAIKDINVKQQVEKFLKRLKFILMINKAKLGNIGNLPQLSIVPYDDESVLVEWMFKDFRVGFSFEKNENESMWYIVSNRNFNEANETGPITDRTIDGLIIDILAFVISHI